MGTRNLEGHGSERNVTLNDRERILEEKEEESERWKRSETRLGDPPDPSNREVGQ